MYDPGPRLLAATLPSFILLFLAVFLLLISNQKFFRSSFLPTTAKNTLYSDKDGCGSTDSALARWQRLTAAVLFLATISTSICKVILAQVVTSDDLANELLWFATGWFATATLAIIFAVCAIPRPRYYIGLAVFFSALPLIAIESYSISAYTDLDNRILVVSYAQIAIGVILALVATSVRERPTLFRDSHPVTESDSTSFLSRLTFSWAWPLLYLAFRKGKLEAENIAHLNHSMRSETMTDRILRRMGMGTKLWLPLLKDHIRLVLLESAIVFAMSACLYVPSVALNQFLRILEQQNLPNAEKTAQAVPWAIAMVAASSISVLLGSWNEWVSWSLLNISLTSQLYTIIFHKCLRMEDSKRPEGVEEDDGSDAGSDGGTEGDESEDDREAHRNVMNLLGVDVDRVSYFISKSSQLPCALLETIFGVGFLMTVLGWKSTLIGLSVPIVLYPIHRWTTTAYSKTEDRAMKVADDKTHKVTEVLHAVKQIKFSANEDRWKTVIMAARFKELAVQKSALMIELVMTMAWSATPILLGAVALTSYSFIHGNLPASVAFTTISVVQLLEYSISILPHSIVDLINARISMRRIEQHLERTDKQDYQTNHNCIKLENASLTWTLESASEEDVFRLDHLNLSFPPQKLSVITGMSGTGKSLLLAGLIGEAALLEGSFKSPLTTDYNEESGSEYLDSAWIIPSTKAFLAQSPWLENATIADNILFGLPHVQSRYDEVIRACALEDDIAALDDGHDTEVGALGINLSGGQRLRLTLARALYSRAQILILDDVFSAVDAHVGRQILEQAILGDLCAKRTVIVATHHVNLVVPHASYVVEVADRTAVGTSKVPEPRATPSNGINDLTVKKTLSESPGKIRAAPRKFVEDEARHTGAVKAEVYRRYMKAAGGPLYWLFVVILFAIVAAIDLSSSYVVKLWTEQSQVSEDELIVKISTGRNDNIYLGLYIGISIVLIGLLTLELYVVYLGSLLASKRLFVNMMDSVLASPLRWIERVPTGRLLNRFVADFENVDRAIYGDIHEILIFVSKLAAIVGSALVVSLWMAFPSIGLLLLAVGVVLLYLPGAREVKRLHSTARSPILDFFSSVLSGLSTIRAFDKAEAHLQKMHTLINKYAELVCARHLLSCWMNMWQGSLGVVFLACVLAFLLTSNANASLTGFVLSFAMSYSEATSWLVRNYADLEVNMNAVERILEYTDITTEASDGQEPPPDWPSQGALSIKDLEVAYDTELPSVLKNVTFQVLPRERIGIVGRTGSGKSTMILALFRFLDQRKGRIEIDGVDIATVPLYSLRKRLSLIPQDPVLFTGTLRSNLDPFGLYTNEELLDVLRRVARKTPSDQSAAGESRPESPTLPSSDTGKALTDLEHVISRGGTNVSQGQRQLICLARAMLDQPRVILLDEATSAVDFETDALIQQNLRERFQNSSLLVIAHRLGTIVDFDKVLVMGDGRVLEFGKPGDLYRANGHFTGMVDQSGDREVLLRTMEI